jgi:hypothetical protein
MKSKLLQKISHGPNRPREVVNSPQQSTEDSSVPWPGRETPPNPVNPAVDAQAGNGFPSLLKHGCRPARS